MITETNKTLAQWAMEYALKNGCQASRVALYNGSNSSFEVRDMKIDRLQQASENSLVMHLFVDGRYGTFSTNRLHRHELETFIGNAIDSTRYLAQDRARTLPPASLYFRGADDNDLHLFDPRFDDIRPDDKVSLAMQTCHEMMGQDPRIISANASFCDEKEFRYVVASNGLEARAAGSAFSLTAGVSIRGEGDARPEGDWYDTSLYFDTLMKEGIGTKALRRALDKLGQRKAPSGNYRMVVDNLNAARLLSPLIGAINGAAVQQKNTFLPDSLDRQVLGANVTLTDEPHRPKAPGARYFDHEGVATAPREVFRNGVLKTYYIDTYYANKMQTAQTISGPSILTLQGGERDMDGLVAATGKGILVTGFNGGNCNSSTGDFSYGIEGFLIDNGTLLHPLSEMNITGNMLTLWNSLSEAGNDPRLSSAWRIPSLAFEEVDFSGL